MIIKKCSYCSKLGHIANDCLTKRRQETLRSAVGKAQVIAESTNTADDATATANSATNSANDEYFAESEELVEVDDDSFLEVVLDPDIIGEMDELTM